MYYSLEVTCTTLVTTYRNTKNATICIVESDYVLSSSPKITFFVRKKFKFSDF